jgi:bacillithiol biosynthesis cysteine-adding enzyme BshC
MPTNPSDVSDRAASPSGSSSTSSFSWQRKALSYRQTGRFSKLVCDYIEGDPVLRQMAAFSPDFAGLEKALEALDTQSYPRAQLSAYLRRQYAELPDAGNSLEQIAALENGAHAVVTAHQLNLFGGPLYWLYKAAAVVHLARAMEARFAGRRIVPVFWLGTEDHDFAEINHFTLFGHTLKWEREASGCTGDLDLEGMDAVESALSELVGTAPHADSLMALFRQAYRQPGNLAEAQTRLLHALFGAEGLLVMHADDPELRRVFVPVAERELRESMVADLLAAPLEVLAANWHVQAAPRDINLFYRAAGVRERIERQGDGFVLAESGLSFSAQELLDKVQGNPHCISPNVLLRPLQQQGMLPAVAFVGGGSELAYWLPLKPLFEACGIFMPVLLLRPSVLWIDPASTAKLEQWGWAAEEMFDEEEQLVKEWVRRQETADLSLEPERQEMEAFYQALAEKVQLHDASLVGKVAAERAAHIQQLDKLEQRLVRAAKNKHEVALNQFRKVIQRFFPDRGLQERRDHFGMLWLRHGPEFIQVLIDTLDPLDARFSIVSEPGEEPGKN